VRSEGPGAVFALSSLDIASENVEHGIYYEPTPTAVFREILRNVPIHHEEFLFCDLGCGLGRALLPASDYPFLRHDFTREIQRRVVVYRN